MEKNIKSMVFPHVELQWESNGNHDSIQEPTINLEPCIIGYVFVYENEYSHKWNNFFFVLFVHYSCANHFGLVQF